LNSRLRWMDGEGLRDLAIAKIKFNDSLFFTRL
jgi:hypothetical protein